MINILGLLVLSQYQVFKCIYEADHKVESKDWRYDPQGKEYCLKHCSHIHQEVVPLVVIDLKNLYPKVHIYRHFRISSPTQSTWDYTTWTYRFYLLMMHVHE